MSIRIDADVETSIDANTKAGRWLKPILPGWVLSLKNEVSNSQTANVESTPIDVKR
jgi:hypothetical protein